MDFLPTSCNSLRTEFGEIVRGLTQGGPNLRNGTKPLWEQNVLNSGPKETQKQKCGGGPDWEDQPDIFTLGFLVF